MRVDRSDYAGPSRRTQLNFAELISARPLIDTYYYVPKETCPATARCFGQASTLQPQLHSWLRATTPRLEPISRSTARPTRAHQKYRNGRFAYWTYPTAPYAYFWQGTLNEYV